MLSHGLTSDHLVQAEKRDRVGAYVHGNNQGCEEPIAGSLGNRRVELAIQCGDLGVGCVDSSLLFQHVLKQLDVVGLVVGGRQGGGGNLQDLPDRGQLGELQCAEAQGSEQRLR